PASFAVKYGSLNRKGRKVGAKGTEGCASSASVRARQPPDEEVNRVAQRQQRERVGAILRVAPDRAGEEGDRADKCKPRRQGVAPRAVAPGRVGSAPPQHEHGEERERVVGDEEEGDGRQQSPEG